MADHDLAGNQGRRAIARSLAGALLAGLVLLTAAVRPGAAAEGEAADWPCQQRLVPEIAAAMIWAGPALDSVADAAADPTIRHLAGELAARRVPLEQASAQIDQFAKGLPAEHKDERLTQLFASTLARINEDRGSIIGGIKKYAHGQQALAERVNASNEQLAQLAADQVQEREALIAQRGWDMRIYDDRRASLAYLCEQPVLLEQRAFALARAIAGHLE